LINEVISNKNISVDSQGAQFQYTICISLSKQLIVKAKSDRDRFDRIFELVALSSE